MILVSFLLRLWAASPAEANAWVAGEDVRLRVTLDRTCLRESRCKRLGVHAVDAHHGPSVWRAARRAGYLTPGCPGHDDPNAGWATRGAHGLMAGYHWPLLPAWLQCAPPSVFDVPLVSAYVAARKAMVLCERRGACSYRDRRRWWARGSE